jgi:hypothetical protein
MPSDSIVDTQLQVPLTMGDARRANALFATDSQSLGHLANQILVYDQVIIPTKDFGIILALISWLGPDLLRDAIEHEAISFVHLPTMLGYGGNGAGIVSFSVGPGENRQFQWWQEAIFGDMQKAIELQIHNLPQALSEKGRRSLSEVVHKASRAFAYEGDEFHDHIVDETYRDIMASQDLSAGVALLSGNPDRVDLTTLPGLDPNQMQVSRRGPINGPADIVLRVAEMNLSALVASKSDNSDLLAPTGADLVLRAKLARSGASPTTVNSLLSLFELTGVPDPGSAVASGNVDFKEVWRIRNQGPSRKFRKWIQEVSPGDSRDLERAYVDSLGSESWIASLPAKAIRFVLTAGVGVVNPLLGTALSVADSFFVERLLQGYSPKLFIDDMKSLLVEK